MTGRNAILVKFNQAAIVSALVVLRHLVSLWPYSGQRDPPIYGDYEAQRHWMEITLYHPIKRWYWYDASYWGLDYPPLTAYVSWLCGLVSKIIIPDSMTYYESRGFESPEHMVLMRFFVLFMDLITWFPAVIWSSHFIVASSKKDIYSNMCAAMSMGLLFPSLILIDHGHYQYNCACVGLALGAISAIFNKKEFLGAFLFTLSLNFKHMALYYAPAIFFYLLNWCLSEQHSCRGKVFFCRFLKLGSVVLVTFGVLWAPFCLFSEQGGCLGGLRQVFIRLFPFHRGIFEDKVANIWCTLHVLLKIRRWISEENMPILSTILTCCLLLPACVELMRKDRENSFRRLLLASSVSALSFFLAGFQVHEKGIILPLAPLSMLWIESPLFVSWLEVFGAFSMYPLLQREGLSIPYFVCTLSYVLASWLLATNVQFPEVNSQTGHLASIQPFWRRLLYSIIILSSISLIVLHLGEMFGPLPPSQYPHIYPVLNMLLSCAVMVVGYFVLMTWLWNLPSQRLIQIEQKNK